MKILRIPLVIVMVVAAGRAFNAGAQTVTETNLHSFAGNPDGFEPLAGLVQGNDGNFYGTTRAGGLGNAGTAFRISPSGSEMNVYSFGVTPNDGYYPDAGLVQGSDGNFYGTASFGGTSTNCNGGCGTVFRISPSSTETTLYSFAGYPTDGANPEGGLVQGSDGNFYGTASYGGTYSNGTIFRISPIGSYTSLYSFVGYPDGANPYAGLVRGSDGNLYGTTQNGGTNNEGTVFRISPSGTYTTLHFFVGSPNDGGGPDAGLVQGNDSNFYGTTYVGGTYSNYGTVFRISPSGTYTTLHFFVGSPNDGGGPAAGLVQGSDGNFYGTASYGGTYSNGTGFRISPSGNYTSLYSFVGNPNDGEFPYAGLVQGSDGNFYGTTYEGGPKNYGTVFRLDVGLRPCTYSLSTDSGNFGATGGSCNVGVSVSNDCAWTASTTDTWITISSGSSGTGNGTVSYTVAANTTTTSRGGTVTIGGQTLTVDQAGATPVTYKFSKPFQTLKTKLNKKSGITTTNCTVALELVVANTGTTATAKSSVLLWLDQGCAFNPSVGLVPLTVKVKALKVGKLDTIKIKTKKLTEDLAGTLIFATDPEKNVLAFVEVPSPE
jgi:uncharacterized repeat protein (TIGR03803 family)